MRKRKVKISKPVNYLPFRTVQLPDRPETGSTVIFACNDDQQFCIDVLKDGVKCKVVGNYKHTVGIRIGRKKIEYLVHPDFLKGE